MSSRIKQYINFIWRLTLLTLVIAAVIAGAQWAGYQHVLPFITWYNLGFFYLLSALVFVLALRSVVTKKHRLFMQYFLASLLIKFLVAIAYLVLVLYLYPMESPVPFLVSFFTFYVLYTGLQIRGLLKGLKMNKGSAT